MLGSPVTQRKLKRRQYFWIMKIMSALAGKQKQAHFNPSVFVMHRRSRFIARSKRNMLLNSHILQSSYALNMKTSTHPHPCNKSCWSSASIKRFFPRHSTVVAANMLKAELAASNMEQTVDQGPAGYTAHWSECVITTNHSIIKLRQSGSHHKTH